MGERGQQGAPGLCPNCGRGGVVWNSLTDISRCLSCGWTNAPLEPIDYDAPGTTARETGV